MTTTTSIALAAVEAQIPRLALTFTVTLDVVASTVAELLEELADVPGIVAVTLDQVVLTPREPLQEPVQEPTA